MTSTNLFKRIGIATLSGALLITPIAAMAQAPYGAPTPDQYAAQNPQYANPQGQNADQYNDPNGQYPHQGQSGQQAPPQPGVPQGIEQTPPAIPAYDQPAAPGDGYIWTPG